MTIDQHLTALSMSSADIARALGIDPVHAWKLRHRRIQPSLKLADRIIKWSGGAVRICDLTLPAPVDDKEDAAC